MQQWNSYAEKFLQLTKREQYIVFFAGLFLFLYVPYILIIETNFAQIDQHSTKIVTLKNSVKTEKQSIELFEQALNENPNAPIEKQIAQQKEKLEKIDAQLLTLTSELINPIQMRKALVELLALEPNVSLVSFEVLAPKALLTDNKQIAAEEQDKDDNKASNSAKTVNSKAQPVGLYRHGIQLKLKGRYASLQDYLVRLERLKWKFFWQDFELKVTKYPTNELSVTLYSLSTKRDFIGV
ncbi:type II secretion system protein M [Thalassotalea sp. M1531]|uniref:Type II secretion system protein M n=1 Tax=Thalassotalea algicola TaxID=2716224 RepID=A0A7Y0Q6Z1_9GAMM|nr:type II secretion system protein M [Thalassotalea algicola]NMP31923.1 type II secretion system protein M [Thalassotalea algicola]